MSGWDFDKTDFVIKSKDVVGALRPSHSSLTHKHCSELILPKGNLFNKVVYLSGGSCVHDAAPVGHFVLVGVLRVVVVVH